MKVLLTPVEKAGTLQRRVLTSRGASRRHPGACAWSAYIGDAKPVSFSQLGWPGGCQRLCAGTRTAGHSGLWSYASAEVIELSTADAPRKGSQPKRDEAIVNFINSMTEGLSI